MEAKPARKVAAKKALAYQPKKGEEAYYHVKQEQVRFDPATGERQSAPRVAKYEARIWENSVRKNMKAMGYTFEVLHSPNKK